MSTDSWVAGVDLGGTKIKIIQVNTDNSIGEQVKYPTNVEGGPEAVDLEIIEAVDELAKTIGTKPKAIGIGVAGQVDGQTGAVKFAPNLKWKNVPLQADIHKMSGLPVVVTNDVRAATWGEWLNGAGKGTNDLICVFIGTGIGGGIVSGGQMLDGFNNTAGEIGHITVSLNGPDCTCGNNGCMEAFAGGWALSQLARDAILANPDLGKKIINLAGGDRRQIKGQHVMEAAVHDKDTLAIEIVDQAIEALGAGISSLVNSFSPQRIIFGGGVVEGNLWLVDRITPIISERSLGAALEGLDITKAQLHNDAGAIGAGALAIRTFLY